MTNSVDAKISFSMFGMIIVRSCWNLCVMNSKNRNYKSEIRVNIIFLILMNVIMCGEDPTPIWEYIDM